MNKAPNLGAFFVFHPFSVDTNKSGVNSSICLAGIKISLLSAFFGAFNVNFYDLALLPIYVPMTMAP